MERNYGSYATAAGVAAKVTVADESTDTTCFVAFVTAATGDLAVKSGTNLAFNSNTGELTATKLAGAFNGTLGATTPAAVSATTIGASGVVSLENYAIWTAAAAQAPQAGFFTAETNTGTGKLFFQAGAGSGAYGGGLNLFAHQHATKPGSVVAGISTGSGGVFGVTPDGLCAGAYVFTVNALGSVWTNSTITSNGILSTTSVVDASSATVAALVSAGGVALAKSLWVGTTSRLVGNVGIGAASSANADLLLEAGRLMLKESATPTADAGYGKLYTKTDDKLYFQDGAGVEKTVSTTGTSVVFKGYAAGDFGNAGTHYLAGFYEAPAAHAVLTIGGAVTQTYGTAGEMKAAHAFCVASGAGGTDLVLTVTGISIAEDGTRNDADSEIIVADADTATTDAYYETTKKWLGQITYTLTGAAGAFTFNYGFAKYDDFGDRDFTITDFEMVLKGAASETGFDVQLLHHKATGWTYSAAAFSPGTTPICSSLTDNSATNDNFTSGDGVAYKRTALSTAVSGSTVEGAIIKIITAVNNSVRYGDCHIGVTL